MDLRDRGYVNPWGVLYCSTYPLLRERHLNKFQREYRGMGVMKETRDEGLHFKWAGEGMGGVRFRNLGDDSDSGGGARGSENLFGLFDELTEFNYEAFSNALYTIRPDSSGVPYVAIGAATNPDGKGHGWVKKIFVPGYQDTDQPFFGNGARSVDQVLYVPAKKEDNPAYVEQKEVVDAIMAGIEDPDIRAARESGSWDLYAGGRFPMFRMSVHGCSYEDLYDHYGIHRSIRFEDFLKNAQTWGFSVEGSLDYATSLLSVSAYLLHLIGPDNFVWTFARLKMIGLELERQAEEILKFEKMLGLSVDRRYADPAIWSKAAEDKRGPTRVTRFRDCGVRFKKASNNRVEGAATCASLLLYRADDQGRVLSPPRAHIFKRDGVYGAPELLAEIPDLPRDPDNQEDVDPADGKWHWYDSWRYQLHTRLRGTVPKGKQIVEGSMAYYRLLAEMSRRRNAVEDDF
jgi:hypothetical protein